MDAKDAVTPSRESEVYALARKQLDSGLEDERTIVARWCSHFGNATVRTGVTFDFREGEGWSVTIPLGVPTPRRWRLIGELAGLGESWNAVTPKGRKRAPRAEPETVIRALAVHYLSRAGGGAMTAERAFQALLEHVPALGAYRWDPPDHYATIRRLGWDYGFYIKEDAA